MITKVPKAKGVKERYIIEERDKVYSSKGPTSRGDPITMKPANGILKGYYDNGQLSHEAILVDGYPLGKFYAYHDNGNVAELRQYVKGHQAADGLDIHYGKKTGKVVEIIVMSIRDPFKRIFEQGKVIYHDEE